jgi:hypothetical protein
MKVLITENLPSHPWKEGIVISPEKGDNFFDLDKFLDHNECSEIFFTLTDYVPTSQLSDAIAKLSTKLAHGGKLVISGTDALVVTQAFQNGRINILEFNELVYGKRNKVWAFKQSLVALNDVVAICKANGLKVTQKRLSDFTYSVIGERE